MYLLIRLFLLPLQIAEWLITQALTTGEGDLTAKRRVESRGRKYILPKLNLGKFSRKKTVAKCFVRFSKTSSAIKRFDFSIISVWLLNVVFQLAFFFCHQKYARASFLFIFKQVL